MKGPLEKLHSRGPGKGSRVDFFNSTHLLSFPPHQASPGPAEKQRAPNW